MATTETRTTDPQAATPELEGYRSLCRDWLTTQFPPLSADREGIEWGEGDDDVAVFHSMTAEDERWLIERGGSWQRVKLAAGFGAIAWPAHQGGAGLTTLHAQVFREVEDQFAVPPSHELLRVTTNLVAPTVRDFGTESQRARFIAPLLAADELACQLFSEPGAGSDLASVTTRARRDGEYWIVTGSKVWASGAQFAQWGELLARTDPDAPKHSGLTMFLVPLDTPGVQVLPIRQMSGGSSFNQVFLDDVRIHDSLRLGEIGSGWRVALTTLGYEREQSGARRVGASWPQVRALASWTGLNRDPLVRQELSKLYAHERLREITRLRANAARNAGEPTGPAGSIGKLLWVQGMTKIGELAASLLGMRMTADTGEWGTFAWTQHFLGAAGFRIAGGSDEIQRNIIAERILGLPGDIRVDRTSSQPRAGLSGERN